MYKIIDSYWKRKILDWQRKQLCLESMFMQLNILLLFAKETLMRKKKTNQWPLLSIGPTWLAL